MTESVGLKMEFLLMAESQPNKETSTVKSFASLVNEYGFMIIFSVVVLILLIIFFVKHEKRSGQKQEQELKLITKEREAAIAQNQQMFELVTKTQTEQVTQLREMTDSLRDMNTSTQISEHRISDALSRLDDLRISIKSCDGNTKVILEAISDILTNMKTTQDCSQQILDKLDFLERKLIHEKPGE